VTIVNKTAGGEVKLSNIKGLTDRPGDQGNGMEQSFPYSWDKNQNVRFGGSAVTTGTLGAKVEVHAPGPLSSDLAFRVVDSTGSYVRLDIRGDDTIYIPSSEIGMGTSPVTNQGITINCGVYTSAGIKIQGTGTSGINISGALTNGIYAQSSLAGGRAVRAIVTGTSSTNKAIQGIATTSSSGTNVALELDAQNGVTNKAIDVLNGEVHLGTDEVYGAPFYLAIAVSDETTPLTTGTAKVTFRMPYKVTLKEVRSSLTTAGTGAALVTVDINEGGASILSTKLTIDATQKTSKTATTPAVISDTVLADDAEMTVDIDTIDTGGVSAGLKIYLIGYKTK
jgi:hypothetical protein